MLATRPILLYTLIQSRIPGSGNKDTAPSNTHTLKTLGDACINAARHTHALIVEEWTNGSMPIFGYFYAHYLFSCALIMVVSSQIHAEHCSDYALFETALEILRAMTNHGNLAATEFYDNLECVRQCLDKNRGSPAQKFPSIGSLRPRHQNSPDMLPLHTNPATGRPSEIGLPGDPVMSDIMVPGNLTDEMVFLDQSMEEFLARTDADLGPFDPSGVPVNMADGMWPNFSLWTA